MVEGSPDVLQRWHESWTLVRIRSPVLRLQMVYEADSSLGNLRDQFIVNPFYTKFPNEFLAFWTPALNSTIHQLKKIIENVLAKSTDNPVKFYRETNNHIPPWILVKNLYFDTCIKLYEFLTNALNLIRRMRSVTAHNGK